MADEYRGIAQIDVGTAEETGKLPEAEGSFDGGCFREVQQDEIMLELEYLRFFHGAVDSYLGAGSDDVYHSISETWREQGKELPYGYAGEDL